MLLQTYLSSLALSAMLLTPAASHPTHDCNFKPTHRHQKAVADRYLGSWNGNYDLFNATFASDVHLYQDRFPSANGTTNVPISSSADFFAFITRARSAFEKYEFEAINFAGDGNNVVIRWTLNAIANENTLLAFPSATIQPGDPFTYNGTDWLQVDRCGKVKQVESAQDLITSFYNLGIPFIKIT